MRRKGWRVAGLSAALGLVLTGLFACDGDTLYDSPPAGVTAPSVAITDPPDGLQILAGKPLHVNVTADDSLGISQLQIRYTGAATGSIVRSYSPARLSIEIDTIITTPSGVDGVLELQAVAFNRLKGTASAVPVDVLLASVDSIRPVVALQVSPLPARLEIDDSITAVVTAADNRSGSGLATIGLNVVVASSTRTDTLVYEQIFNLPQIDDGTVAVQFDFLPPFADERRLPDDLSLQFHAFAVDSAGNCAASTGPQAEQLVCVERSFASGTHIVSEKPPGSLHALVVAGRSTVLPNGSLIADAVADVPRGRLYMSNKSLGRIEILDIRNNALLPTVRVGAEPWGVALNRTADTLIVANSGGTSISFVSLTGTPSEHLARRFQTLNSSLFKVPVSPGFVGGTTSDSLHVAVYDFSDRPQFVAQDANGVLLYSTLQTASRQAAIRMVRHQSGWQRPEVYILRGPEAVVPLPDTSSLGTLIVANVDSARFDGQNGCLELFDHVTGSPVAVIRSGCVRPDSAVYRMSLQSGTDIYYRTGEWNLRAIEYADPTFVAASADRSRIIFGEGTVSTGRIRLWKSDSADVSNEITMEDLVGNGAEQILDVQMNPDGTLGMARGVSGAYTFKRDLRLQGFVRPGTTAERSGAVLHPQHPSFPTYGNFPASGPTTVMFVDDGDAIGIYDTVHYTKRGEIPIRDAMIGPLRVSAPLSSDNSGCTGSDCVVAKLYGVTDAGAVVVINVRAKDIS